MDELKKIEKLSLSEKISAKNKQTHKK